MESISIPYLIAPQEIEGMEELRRNIQEANRSPTEAPDMTKYGNFPTYIPKKHNSRLLYIEYGSATFPCKKHICRVDSDMECAISIYIDRNFNSVFGALLEPE